MLRARNTFFSESNMNSLNYVNPSNYPNMSMPNVQAQSASNSYYQGPAMNYQDAYNYQNSNLNDYDNRLAKIERSINRLDARVTKLENKAQVTTEDINNTLYMV